MENVKINKSKLFKLMNKIAREAGMTQKAAYAEAKRRLIETDNVASDALLKVLMKNMKNGNVKFTFKNRNGKFITTTGTLRFNKVPTNRKVEGRKSPKNDDMILFYDVRHGVYRQFNKNNIIEILSK